MKMNGYNPLDDARLKRIGEQNQQQQFGGPAGERRGEMTASTYPNQQQFHQSRATSSPLSPSSLSSSSAILPRPSGAPLYGSSSVGDGGNGAAGISSQNHAQMYGYAPAPSSSRYAYAQHPTPWRFTGHGLVPAQAQEPSPPQVESVRPRSSSSDEDEEMDSPRESSELSTTLPVDGEGHIRGGKLRKTDHPERDYFRLEGIRKVRDPPHLEEWRQRLFDLDEPLTMTQDEFSMYFPHVDNVYSHRSTQKYRKNPYAAHYWDCRLKGRPSGTKKSTDPNKKKRNRIAREPDQCNVKIKILEFFPRTIVQVGNQAVCSSEAETDAYSGIPAHAPFGVLPHTLQAPPPPVQIIEDERVSLPLISAGGASVPQASADGKRIYLIQRVLSGGTGGQAKGPDRHRHDIDYSDKIKKNSIVREMLKDEKEKRKTQKQYHKKATGEALKTVESHSDNRDVKLYGSCFCPFVQRVWISLEHKKLPYQYIEVDPYKKPKWFLDINPRGLVPALRHGDWTCHESSVLMEYLEDISGDHNLLPSDPKARAHSRLWADHINRHVVPAFYHFLQAQEPEKQIAEAQKFKEQLDKLVEAAADPGPFFLGAHLSFVDVQFAPWLVRLNRVLKPYRSWPDPEPGSRFEAWSDAIEAHEAVRATTSSKELYLDSYERYAENRPNTSQLADAVNGGRGLP